jgi:hypothetical protein
MTHFENQSDLDTLSVTELRWKLHEIFNALAAMQKNSPECEKTLAALDEVQKALRRKANTPKP